MYMAHITIAGTYFEDLLLLLPGDLGLKQLCAEGLVLLFKLLVALRGVLGLGFGCLQSLHVCCMEQHLLLVLVLGLGCETCLLLAIQHGLLLVSSRHSCLLQRFLVLGLQAAQVLFQFTYLKAGRS